MIEENEVKCPYADCGRLIYKGFVRHNYCCPACDKPLEILNGVVTISPEPVDCPATAEPARKS